MFFFFFFFFFFLLRNALVATPPLFFHRYADRVREHFEQFLEDFSSEAHLEDELTRAPVRDYVRTHRRESCTRAAPVGWAR